MRYDIIMDLARGIPTATKQLRDHFLPTGKMLAKQFHFYSGPSSMLRFSSYIAMQFINLNADHWERIFFVIFLVRLELRRINVLVRGLGVSLSLFSQ